MKYKIEKMKMWKYLILLETYATKLREKVANQNQMEFRPIGK